MTTNSLSSVSATSSTSTNVGPNSISALSQRLSQGLLGWRWPLLLCFLRFPLFLACFGILLAVFTLTGHPQPFAMAQGLTIYDVPVAVDLFCLFILARVLRKEGLRLRDLVNFSRKHIFRDLAIGIGLFMLVYVLAFALVVGIMISLSSILGSSFINAQTVQSLQANTGINPLGLPWHIIISVVLLPITTGCVEEMLYRGYVQPRLRVLTGRTSFSLLIMSLGFGLQHIAFGLTSWQFALIGVLYTFVFGLIFGVLNLLNRQRLLPLMLIHWQSNFISLGLAPLFLVLFLK